MAKCEHMWVDVGQASGYRDIEWCARCGIIRRMKVHYADVNRLAHEGKKYGHLYSYFKPLANRNVKPDIDN